MTGAYWSTVKTYAKRNGIKLRSHKEQAAISSPGGMWKHENLLTQKFFEQNYIRLKKSIKDISLETGIQRSVIRDHMRKLGIAVRTCHEQINISHPPKEFKLTKECVAFIDGLLLGDGSVPFRRGGNPRNYTQGCKHKEYLVYVAHRLKKYGITSSPILTKWTKDFRCKNNGYLESFLQTRSYKTFRIVRERWYDKDGVKHIPQSIAFTSDSILQFYLGDGNFYREIVLCTNGFSLKDIELLQRLFEINLKIKTRIINSDGGYEIAIKKSDIKKFLTYIGRCPVKCYKYKWHDNESLEKKLEKNKRARKLYHLKKLNGNKNDGRINRSK